MYQSFLIPFFAILIAEFLDKSQLSIILLASKTKHHFSLLIGVLLAFLVVDGIAILFGSYLTSLIPLSYVKILSGVLFILFGVKTLLEKPGKKQHLGKIKNVFLSGFTLVFLSEWGDKTQLASALFATRYNPFVVFLGVLAALTLLSIMAVYLSKILSTYVDRGIITKVAGAIFILLGVSFFIFN